MLRSDSLYIYIVLYLLLLCDRRNLDYLWESDIVSDSYQPTKDDLKYDTDPLIKLHYAKWKLLADLYYLVLTVVTKN